MQELKLNLGCGDNKIKGYVNIDRERSCKPDLVLDFRTKLLPYKNNTVSEVVFFHCIEHIEKTYHRFILLEVGRILKPEGLFYLSYPNFWECAQRWKDNVGGLKRFWEATLYGRQLYKSDYHVCAMDPSELENMLYECGFKNVKSFPEPTENYNSITVGSKDPKGPAPTYESTVAQDMDNMVVRKL